MEENGIKRAQRRLEEQHGAIDRYSTIEGAGEIAQMPIHGNNAPSFETIEPFAVRQGFLEELTASYRATEEIYTRAHAELDQRRMEALKKSSIEFTHMLEEWQKQITTIQDPKQRKALEEAFMGCRRWLRFGHAAELNRSSQLAERNVVNDSLRGNSLFVEPKSGGCGNRSGFRTRKTRLG
jgi:hypothetical protein